MTDAFRFKAATPSPGPQEIAALRRACPHGIAEIRRRTAAQQSLLDIEVFGGDWPEGEARLEALLQAIEARELPLVVWAVEAGPPEREEALGIDQARQRLAFLREIARSQDMQARLRAGHVDSPEAWRRLHPE